MHRSAVPAALCAALLLALSAAASHAQGVSAFGEDALVLSRGIARLGFAPTWTNFNQRYRADGTAEPLAIDLDLDTLGANELPVLGPLQEELRSLSNLPNLRLSVGRTRVDLDASILTVPFSAELGIGGRLSLGVVVPVVRVRSHVVFSPNPTVSEGNVGINPAIDSEAARNQNETLVTQFDQAVQALRDLIEACQDPSNSDPRCPQARLPEAGELADAADAFAGGVTTAYDAEASLFVPVSTSPLDEAIRTRIEQFVTSFATYDIGGITVEGPASATMVGLVDFRRVLTDTSFGIRAQPLASRVRTSLGDVEIGAKLQLVNTVPGDTLHRSGLRAALGAAFRLGTGETNDPDDFSDIPSGDGQNDIEARTYWDIFLGSRVALSLVGRYVLQLPDREIMRIAGPRDPFPAYWRRHEVDRDLGDIIDLQIMPRVLVGDFFSLMGQYRVRRKAEDRHTGRFEVNNELGDPVTLDAAVLDAETEQREDRLSFGLGYSTLASVARGRSRIPLEVFLQYGESIRGSGGRTPKVSVGVMHVRVYWF